MTAIATLSGFQIDFLNPQTEQVNLLDLAAGLSRAPRYTGQTVREYSVAQHSLLVAAMVPEKHRLAALIHDAPEAYLCDVPSPAKEAMRAISTLTGHQSPYDILERNLFKAIARKFGVSEELPAEVLEADAAAMRLEAEILQPEGWKLPLWDFAKRMAPPTADAMAAFKRFLVDEHRGRYGWAHCITTYWHPDFGARRHVRALSK